MLEGARSGIRDGRETAFWTGRWLDSGTILIDYVREVDDNIDLHTTVSEMVLPDGSWNVDYIRHYLEEDLVDEIVGMSPPTSEQGVDEWIWSREINGKFSIRTAYDIVYSTPNNQSNTDWNVVWKWAGPGCVQYFLWLVSHGKILTNVERKRRHLSVDELCPRCRVADESIIHVLRDCQFAGKVWDDLGFDNNNPIRSGHSSNNWVKTVLNHEKALELGIACWWIWKSRNEWVFSGTSLTTAALAYRIKN
ncbi:Putative ribonuclease H protein At1g65750 [Linum perenne]